MADLPVRVTTKKKWLITASLGICAGIGLLVSGTIYAYSAYRPYQVFVRLLDRDMQQAEDVHFSTQADEAKIQELDFIEQSMKHNGSYLRFYRRHFFMGLAILVMGVLMTVVSAAAIYRLRKRRAIY